MNAVASTIRLTAAQALVRYLAALSTEHGEPLFGGVFAIFGHGNVAGMGEALYRHREELPTYRAHNEQAMAHSAIAFAKAHMRRRMMAVTTSIGPGATNSSQPPRLPTSTACRCCSCPAISSSRARLIRCCSKSKTRMTAGHPRTMRSRPCRDISIASCIPRSC